LQKSVKIDDAPFGSSQMTKNLLELFLIKLHRHKDATPKKERYNYKVNGLDIPFDVKEIVEYLQKHIYEKITVEEVANAVGKSASTVKNLFATYSSGGMIRFFNYLKIEEAKKLIREGQYNFTQIAFMLGFDTPQYFSSCFRQIVKMSPLEYKNSILQ
jgi:AraC-like DNA-binding protein